MCIAVLLSSQEASDSSADSDILGEFDDADEDMYHQRLRHYEEVKRRRVSGNPRPSVFPHVLALPTHGSAYKEQGDLLVSWPNLIQSDTLIFSDVDFTDTTCRITL